MSEEPEHTPLPWMIYDDFDPLKVKIKGFYPDIGGAHVATVLHKANASLIVRSVNAVPDLVKALEPFADVARAFTSAIGPDGIDDGVALTITMHGKQHEFIMSTEAFSNARTVLAKVKP